MSNSSYIDESMDSMATHRFQVSSDFWIGHEATPLCQHEGCRRDREDPVHASPERWVRIPLTELKVGDHLMMHGEVLGPPTKVPDIELDLVDIPTRHNGPYRTRPDAMVSVSR